MLFRGNESVIGSDALDAVQLAYYRDPETGQEGPPIRIAGTEPGILLGRNRSGKDTAVGMVLGLQMMGRSLVWIDPRGEGAAVTAPYRRTLGPVYVLNRHRVLLPRSRSYVPGYEDLESDGWDPIAGMRDPNDPAVFAEAAAMAEAEIKFESGGNAEHFTRRMRGLWLGLNLGEVYDAAHSVPPRAPSYANLRDALTERSEFDPKTGEPTRGLALRAKRLSATAGRQVQSLLDNYAGALDDEIRSVIATGEGHTQRLLDQFVADDMAKNGIDLTELGDRPSTLYVITPPEMAHESSMYSNDLRLLVSSALRSLYRPTNTICTFYINEFAALGRLGAIDANLGLVAGYGIQLILVLQSLTTLKQHYQDGWENYLGQAGWIALVGPPGDDFTASYLAEKRTGQTTFIQPHAGTSMNASGAGFSAGDAYARRPYLMPQDLFNLKPASGHGFVWVPGLAEPIPALFKPFFSDPLLARRARRNPYYRG